MSSLKARKTSARGYTLSWSTITMKGQCHGIFLHQVFLSWIIFPKPLKRVIRIFLKTRRDCLHHKMILKKIKIIYRLILLPKGVQTKYLKLFRLKNFSSAALWAVNISEKFRKNSKRPQWDFQGLNEKNLRSKISWHCPFNTHHKWSLTVPVRRAWLGWRTVLYFSKRDIISGTSS
jgi:hypothetical protein